MSNLPSHFLFQKLSTAGRALLAQHSKQIHLNAKRPLFREGEVANQVFFVASGCLKLSRSLNTGKDVLFYFGIAGDFLRAPLELNEFSNNAIAMGDTEIFAMDVQIFDRLLGTESAFAQGVSHNATKQIAQLNERLSAMALLSLESQVLSLLRYYGEWAGKKKANNTRIEFRLSQLMMAKDLAVSRKAVVRALAGLKRQGAVQKSNARYELVATAKEAQGLEAVALSG